MGRSLPGFSVHGILQAGILEWVSKPSSRCSSNTHPQFEENETAFEWLSGMPKVKKQLLDSALTCKVGNTVRHSFTEIFYVLGAMLSTMMGTLLSTVLSTMVGTMLSSMLSTMMGTILSTVLGSRIWDENKHGPMLAGCVGVCRQEHR